MSKASDKLTSIYCWGWSDDGRLGIGDDTEDLYKWPMPNFNVDESPLRSKPVKHVAGGARHSLYVNSDGVVLASGWNGHGQCGQPIDKSDPNTCFTSPVRVEGIMLQGRPDFCKEVQCGHATSYALTGEGKIYSWGKGLWGALGQDAEEDMNVEDDQPVARILRSLSAQTVVSLTAGFQHVVCITYSKRIYTWGRNNFGQLGLGRESMASKFISTPTEVTSGLSINEKVLTITAGHDHTLLLVQVKRPDQRVEVTVFGWGCTANFRLGNVDERMHHTPQEVFSVTQFVRTNNIVLKDIKAGGAHSMALEKFNGLVIAWGGGQYGQLGHGHVWDRADPVFVTGLRSAVAIDAGQRHSLALVDRISGENATSETDGEVYAWGYNEYGELGMGDCHVRLQAHKLTGLTNADIIGIAAGYRHSMCVSAGNAKKIRDLREYGEYFDLLHDEGMLVYDALKKNMEEKGLNPDFLDTPDMVLPDQPGMENKPCEYNGAEPGMQYCIDTIANPDENLVIMALRGTYETTYECIRCRFHHVCMACARHCHAQHSVRVNFKARKYNDICQCCATDICNVRWNIIRHEFDKLALKEEDRCVALEFVQDLLEALTGDIEKRRGGMPLTSKQKEDDLKAAHDALILKQTVKDDDNDDNNGNDDQNVNVESVAVGAGVAAVRRKSAVGKEEGKKDVKEEEEDVLKTRISFKAFENWYAIYFVVDEIDE